jgi:transcriptional regulator with XRE-family HTH domain
MTFQTCDTATFKARFAKNLIRCRRRAGLSQEKVAIRASISRGAVNKYEKEANVPSLDIVIRLGGALSVPPADLLDGIAYRPSFVGMGSGEYNISEADPGT